MKNLIHLHFYHFPLIIRHDGTISYHFHDFQLYFLQLNFSTLYVLRLGGKSPVIVDETALVGWPKGAKVGAISGGIITLHVVIVLRIGCSGAVEICSIAIIYRLLLRGNL